MKLALVLARSRRKSDEAMLPLINLVFLLMVFFMLVGGVAAPDALQVQPVQARQLNEAGADHLHLLVSHEGQLALGGRVFGIEQLRPQIEAWRQVHGGRSLQLKADARAEAQLVVSLLEQLRSLGLEEVQVLTVQATP
ncbi:MAG: ExbD/TolR family protein [Panacagrimonas sp.]